MKLLFDFLPFFPFFIAYKFYGIYVATAVAIPVSLIQLIAFRIKNKRFETTQVITFFSILILGGATLVLHDEIYIKWKPTILYWILAITFLATSFFGKKPLIQRLLENAMQLPALAWKRLNMSWALFFTLLGGANLYVIYHYSTNTWVNFKVFGTPGLMLVFGIFQSIYMAKHIDLKTTD